MNEYDELNNILTKTSELEYRRDYETEAPQPVSLSDDFHSRISHKLVQWSTSDGTIFIPTATTVNKLTPGCYDLRCNPDIGVYFEKVEINTDNILIFPDAVTEKVVNEIKSFWEKENHFKDFGLTYKRGIILWGSQGTGKSTTLQLISKDVIERGGVIFKFGNPDTFSTALRKFRTIQPDTAIVVLMEDLDAILAMYNESSVINILDGVEKLHKIVFLATTNYPSRLGGRIFNRPSRFDKRFKVGNLNAASRKIYLEFLIGDRQLNIDIDRWVKDTEDFSIAHLKELFVAVVILEDPYEEAIKTLKSMSQKEDEDDNGIVAGFRKR